MNAAEYFAAAATCRTVNEFNRLHIDLENELTPAELAAIWRLRKAPDVPAETEPWLRSLRRLDPSIMASPKAFRRRQLLPRVQLFADDAVPASAKGILVTFCGSTDRLGLPIAAFLQSVDSQQWDVVKVTRERARSYVQGWSEGPTDLPGIAQAIGAAAAVDSYAHAACLGTSSGGLAALIAGYILGAQIAVAVGARGVSGGEIGGIIDGLSPPATLLLAFGGQHRGDFKTASALRSLLGGHLMPIAGIDRHNVNHHLIKLGLLPSFIADLLSGSADPAMLRKWETMAP